MTYDFFAGKSDKLEILNFIFNETDLHIYDLYSPYGQEICEYKAVAEISSKFDLENGDKTAITFQLWTPRHKGKPIFRMVELNPKYRISLRNAWSKIVSISKNLLQTSVANLNTPSKICNSSQLQNSRLQNLRESIVFATRWSCKFISGTIFCNYFGK